MWTCPNLIENIIIIDKQFRSFLQQLKIFLRLFEIKEATFPTTMMKKPGNNSI